MSTIIETERLILREFSAEDARGMFELNNDPEVLRYTGDEPFLSETNAQQFIFNYDHYQRNGFGRWTCLLKPSSEYVGWCGLRYSEQSKEVDIGFRFMRQYWGRGLATEAAKACLKYGKEQLGLQKIVGRACRDNGASIRVLEKMGMQWDFDFEEDGLPWCQFVVT